MKHTLFTLLAALVASPAFAGNLIREDWTTDCGDGQGHAHNYTFVDGNLVAQGGGERGNCNLSYTSTAPKMENGSSLAITLQFASTQGLEDFTVYSSHPKVADAARDYAACLYVWTTSGGYFELKQWDNATDAPISLLSTEASETTASLTLNFIVENGNLCYTYTFNGGKSEKFTAVEGIDTSLAWQPCFSWDVTNATKVTVTDVTFSTSSPMVPEPATATLSLLALAGLSARRRRASR